MIGIYFIGGEDYVSVEKSLLFSFGFDLTQCVHIPILADNCLEQTESFNVSLSAKHIGVNIGVQEITVYICEDGGKLRVAYIFLSYHSNAFFFLHSYQGWV